MTNKNSISKKRPLKKKKDNRGGKREGAGRKATAKRLSFRGYVLKSIAQEYGYGDEKLGLSIIKMMVQDKLDALKPPKKQ